MVKHRMFYIKKFNPEIHHRKSIRLHGWDYTKPGMYFITLATQGVDNILFGEILSGKIVLNEYGNIVEDEWRMTAIIRPNVELDEFVVMPDHFHGIIKLSQQVQLVGATCQVAPTSTNQVAPTSTNQVAPTSANQVAPTERPSGPKPGSVGAIIAQFKMQTTKRINKITGTYGGTIWQRNFYERIIWNCDDLTRIRKYIRNNPQTSPGPK